VTITKMHEQVREFSYVVSTISRLLLYGFVCKAKDMAPRRVTHPGARIKEASP
jgi:hypothetical protein